MKIPWSMDINILISYPNIIINAWCAPILVLHNISNSDEALLNHVNHIILASGPSPALTAWAIPSQHNVTNSQIKHPSFGVRLKCNLLSHLFSIISILYLFCGVANFGVSVLRHLSLIVNQTLMVRAKIWFCAFAYGGNTHWDNNSFHWCIHGYYKLISLLYTLVSCWCKGKMYFDLPFCKTQRVFNFTVVLLWSIFKISVTATCQIITKKGGKYRPT